MRSGTVGLVATLVAVAGLAVSFALGLGTGATPGPSISRSRPRVAAPAGLRPQVQVLNASRIPGRAKQATRVLRDREFDVVEWGNASGYHPDSSFVMHRAGDPAVARRVARALGLQRVRSDPDTSLYVHATVVLGRDWVPPPSAGSH